jgi:hypothetical protein
VGEGKAEVTGAPTIETTPEGGKAVRVAKGSALAYLPEGNIDLRRGKVAVRFRPTWHGADGRTHYLLTVQPVGGFVYFGKLADGRLILNQFDPADGQHYPAQVVSTLAAETWHTATATWDTAKGVMLLFLDGAKMGEFRGPAWQMGRLDNRVAASRLVIPETADALIDDIKIWDVP